MMKEIPLLFLAALYCSRLSVDQLTLDAMENFYFLLQHALLRLDFLDAIVKLALAMLELRMKLRKKTNLLNFILRIRQNFFFKI
jgi:hypothetical protein